MITLIYPSKSSRWKNDLIFKTWDEYWKTLGYLSNTNVHKYYNQNGNIQIVYEHNDLTNSYSGAYRVEYFGDIESFRNEFPAMYCASHPKNNIRRVNRNNFGKTLVQDLNFISIKSGKNTDIILPPTNIELILNMLRKYNNFNEDAWNEGYNLENL